MEPDTADAATDRAAAPAVQHSVWRRNNAGHGAAAKMARALRRIGITLLALVLVVILANLLIAPFRHPETYLVMMSGTEGRLPADVPARPAPTFVAEDFQAFGTLSGVLAREKAESFPWWMKEMNSVAQLQAAGLRLDQLLDGGKDVLVVYVHAQAVTSDGRPVLQWSFDADTGDGGLFPAESLLDAVSRRPAEAKLLLLDAGRVAMEPQRGLLVNDFMRMLPTAVRATRDDRLWVLTSHSLLEQSHVSWSTQRSVFGESVAAGLHGAADLDGDQDVDIQELYRYVSADVWQRVQDLTGGTQTQSPQLLWGGDADLQSVTPPVLLAVSSTTTPPPSETPSGTAKRTAAFSSVPLSTAAARRSPVSGALATPAYSARLGATGAAYTAVNQIVPQPVRTGLASGGIDPGSIAARRVGASITGLSGRQATRPGPQNANAAGTGGAEPPKTGSEAPAAGTSAQNGAQAPGTTAAAGTEAPAQPTPSAVPELLMTGWQLRDLLEHRDGELTSPVDFAPDLWKLFVRRLLACELNFRAGAIVDETQLESDVRKLLTPLQEAQQGLLPGNRANPEIAQLAEALLVSRRPPEIEPASLGMARKFTNCCRAELPKPLQELHSALEQALAADERAPFDEWLKSLSDRHEDFIEVRLARRLADLPELEWNLLRAALQTRLIAETVAAAADQGGTFVRAPIELADRLREAGEQALFDGVGSRRFVRAQRLFEQANALYAAAARRRNVLQTAEILYRDLTFRARDYLSWRAAQGQVDDSLGPRDIDLNALLSHLQTMSALLQDTASLELSMLELHVSALASARDRIDASFSMDVFENGERPDEFRKPPAAGLLPHLESILETPLPAADQRLQGLQAIVPLDAHLQSGRTRATVPRTPYPPRIESLDDWLLLEHRARRELRIAELVAIEIPTASEPLLSVRSDFGKLRQNRLEAFAADGEKPRDSSRDGITRLWDAYHRYGVSLRNFHAAVPRHLEQLLRAEPQLPRAGTRQETSATVDARLRAALSVVRIMGTPPTAQSIDWGNRLRRRTLARHLQWQAERLHRAQHATSPDEASRLANAADALQDHAANLLGEARGPVENPTLQIRAPGEVSLLEQSQRHVDIQLIPATHAQTPVWLVLKFDPQLLAVEPAPGITCYDEQTFWEPFDNGAATPPVVENENSAGGLGDSKANTPAGDLRSPAAGTGLAWAGRLPYRPQQDGAAPTLKLLSGATAELSLRLRSLASSPSPARLFVKAVTPTESVTHEITVRIPSPEVVRLHVDGATGTYTPSNSGVTLHPFPNRSTHYRYRLENRTDAQKSVNIAFFSLGERPDHAIPQSELPPQEAQHLLETWNATTLPSMLPKQSLPPRGSVGIALPEPEAEAPQPAPPGPAPEIPLPQINGGLLMAVTDTQTGMQSLKLIDVAVQQPRRYVLPRVGYDFERERVTILVSTHDPSLLPPDGCTVQAEFIETLPSSSARQLSGVVKAPNFETRLFAEVPSADGKVVHLLLHVDGYPRAFRYRVPCDTLSVDVPETTDALGVRVTSPADGVAYPHGIASIEIKAEVDAPLGAFHDPRDVVEIGIDVDRDRVLSGEPSVRLHSDRSVDVRLQPPSPDGRLVLLSQVGDHSVAVPADSLGSARVGLLARVSTQGRQAWSRSVDAVVDGEPPRIRSMRLIPGKFATAKDQLTVSVDAVDGELSGVATVEAAFDLDQTGKFGEETKPLPAALGPAGRWILTIPLADLNPGTHTLLVRATDQVGNVSPYAKESVIVLDEEQAAARLATLTSPVTGSLRYGNRPVPSAEVVLSNEKQEIVSATTSDALGQFVMPAVPPGKYLLLARGLIRNQVRRASVEVAVPPPPGETPPQHLQLR